MQAECSKNIEMDIGRQWHCRE